MREIRRFTAIGLAEAFLRAVARAIADFASRSANFGKTKRRIMKTTLLLTALLCGSAQADFVADIYKTPSGNFNDPGPMVFAGSITYPSDPHSPALSLGMPNFDWHPFGLTWFTAELHGSFTVATPGSGLFSLNAPGKMYSGASFNIAGLIDPVTGINGGSLGTTLGSGPISRIMTITKPGTYSWEMGYIPEVAQNADGNGQPTGRSWIELIDTDHPWEPTSSVPETSWLCWLLPLGLLLWRRK